MCICIGIWIAESTACNIFIYMYYMQYFLIFIWNIFQLNAFINKEFSLARWLALVDGAACFPIILQSFLSFCVCSGEWFLSHNCIHCTFMWILFAIRYIPSQSKNHSSIHRSIYEREKRQLKQQQQQISIASKSFCHIFRKTHSK